MDPSKNGVIGPGILDQVPTSGFRHGSSYCLPAGVLQRMNMSIVLGVAFTFHYAAFPLCAGSTCTEILRHPPR